jgi:hypothetical protein
MGYTDTLTMAIYIIAAVGIALGAYTIAKIYSKEGFR